MIYVTNKPYLLLKKNGHYSIVHKQYHIFKDLLASLLEYPDKELLRIYLICLYDHEFDLLYDYYLSHDNLILPVDIYYNLARVDYNQSLLDIYEKSNDKEKAISFIQIFNKDMAQALIVLKDNHSLLSAIKKSKAPFLVVMNDYTLEMNQDYIDDIVTLIITLNHSSALLRAIDRNTRNNIAIDNPVSPKILKKLNKENYYHYYCAIQNAYMQNFEQCIIHYYKILNDEDIKREFSKELDMLTQYVHSSGQMIFQYGESLANDYEISENEIKKIGFLKESTSKKRDFKVAQ